MSWWPELLLVPPCLAESHPLGLPSAQVSNNLSELPSHFSSIAFSIFSLKDGKTVLSCYLLK